ncbi:MAG: carboxypeptidase regulatory-like domain-containing protein, partial [Gemmatimonadaceae bacterium]
MNHIVLAGFHTVLALQGGPASVTGVIRDADAGSVISGAIVSLPELNRTTASDADGRYTIAAVPAGPHHISVRKIGYAARTLHAFVPVSGTLEINVSILLLPVAERLATVVVRRPVEVGRSSGGDAISPADETTSIAAIRNNPLLTQPDVLQSLSGGEISVKHEAPGGVHIRGGASDHTSYVLDGIPVFSPYHTAGIFGAWNPDALSHVAVTSAMPSFAHPGTLSGTIAAVTRNSGPRLSTRGSISSTHTGVTLDGPLGIGDAAFLASVRFAYPHLTAWTDDPTYVQGASGDRLLKLDIPAIGGQLKLVGYHSTNEISTASETDAEAGGGAVRGRNTFEWQSQSLGFAWSRAFSTTRVNLIGWSAAIDAESRWKGRMSPLVMTAGRFEQGAVLLAVKTFARSTVTAGGRFESNRNSYVVRFDSGALAQFRIAGRQPLVAAFTNYSAAIGNRAHVDFGSSAALAGGAIRLSPQAQLRWTHSDRLASSAGFARTHQFSQSLRNPESVTAGIFPADLFAGAGPAAFPVARSDLGVVSATYRPTADTRIAVQAWERRFNNLLLVAPFDDEPFATRPIGFGGGRARGASAEASVGSKRYG